MLKTALLASLMVLLTWCGFVHTARAEDGIAVAIVYDLSGSMADSVPDQNGQKAPKHVIAKRSLLSVVDRLQQFADSAKDKKLAVSLLILGTDRVQEALPLADFKAQTFRDWAAAAPQPAGGTPIGEALKLATSQLLASPLTHKHILIITDDYGASQNLLIGLPQWRQFFQPRLQKIIDYGHRHGCKVMLHSDGAIRKLIPDLIEMGLDILNPIEPEAAGMSPASIKEDFGEKLTLHGAASNLNLAHGDPASIRREVERLVAEVAPGGGFILCPSNHLMPDMPVENILALYDAAYELGAYE